MSFYSYDASVNTSTLSTDVALPDRGVSSATASLSPDTPSSDVAVDININWINSSSDPSDQDIDLPTGSERFIFDMNNPSCWPGTGATIFDLSGNGYDCEHAQLPLLYDDPLADTSTNSPCSYVGQTGYSLDSDSTVLDYIETGQNAEGRVYLHINPDIENENAKYVRYPAPGTAPEGGRYTFFMVGEAVGVDDFEQSEEINPSEPLIDEDPDGDFTILGTFRGNLIQVRGNGNRGLSFAGPYSGSSPFNLLPFYGVPVTAFNRRYGYSHTKYGLRGYSLANPLKTFFSNTEYEDQYAPLYEFFSNEDYENIGHVNQIDNYSPGSVYQYTRFDHTGLQVFSITYDGDKARTYINGKFVGEMDMNPDTNSSTSPYWTVGITQNADTTLRACSARENKFYAWGFYDRTLTTEEHLQIHKKYLRHPNPTKSVDVNNIPDHALFNVISDDGRPDVDVKMDSDPSATKSYDISLDLSSASEDVSVTERFKTLWSFKSDFSTATSNEFPMIIYEAYDGQKEELYNFSYNQVGPDGEDGWLKVELKRDYKVGYASLNHSSGGKGDGFGPFYFADNPQTWDETNDGGPLDPSTYFKWTTKLDDYISKGFYGQPTDPVYGRISFKVAYSQLPAEEAPEAFRSSPRMGIRPLGSTSNSSPWIGYDDPPTAYSGFVFNASHDSTAVPGLVDSFFHFDKTFLCGADFGEELGGYFPLYYIGIYPPYSSQNYAIINRPWRQDFAFMRHDTEEVVALSSIVPQGFYIMIKDIEFSHFTAPSGRDVDPVSRSVQARIPYEEGSEVDPYFFNL